MGDDASPISRNSNYLAASSNSGPSNLLHKKVASKKVRKKEPGDD